MKRVNYQGRSLLAIILTLCLLAGCGGRAIGESTDAQIGPDGGVVFDASTPSVDLGVTTDLGEADLRDDPAGWSSTTSSYGQTFCTKAGGLPSKSKDDDWICHLTNGLWFCHGWSSGTPAGPGWSCEPLYTETGKGTFYKCVKADELEDKPPGNDTWVCVKGAIYGGTRCEKVKQTSIPQVGSSCHPGQRIWCDGLVYDGWGQVECDPTTGIWKTKMVNGKQMLDCDESLAGGKVPLTHCACYHFFFNPACCERSDCVVPQGTSGQICPPIPGKLCAHCNPLKPECVEPGAKCIVTNAHETFCGQLCEVTPCPAGYSCMTVKEKQGATKQCVPSDYSCYF